jgi:hypothetical protein
MASSVTAALTVRGVASDPIGLDLVSQLPDPSASLLVELERLQRDRGRESRAVAARALRFRAWSERVPEPRGPHDFGRFAYQRELYEQWAVSDRDACFLKGNQVGISTWALRFALYHADVHAHTVLLTMPTDRMLAGFSRRRIRPVIRASTHLRERIPERAVDNVGERQVGAGWLICRGTQQPIEEVDADAVVFDEYDLSDQDNLEASERRVTGPMSAGLLRRVGVPTVPGYGISAAYETSDQRVWTVRCGCGEWNPMRGAEAFAANVDQEQLAIVCRECRRRLDVQGAGEWVPTHPDRDVRGYHLPKLIVPGVRLDQLVANSRKSRPDQRQAFYNRDLGEAYAPAEHRLSIDQVRACVDAHLRLLPSLRSDRFVTMGVDVASTRALNVVIEEMLDGHDTSGRRVFVGEIEDGHDGTAFQQLCDLMDRYGVTMAAIDRAPERRFAEALLNQFPGRAYMVGYYMPQPGARGDVRPWHVDDEARLATVWRTLAIDATLERFRLGAVRLPPLETLPPEYPAHLGAVVRQTVELAGGQIRAEYRSIGADDFLHAEVFNLAAIELLWRRVGLSRALARGPVPLALLEPGDADAPADVLPSVEPIYRPAFEDDPSSVDLWSPFR